MSVVEQRLRQRIKELETERDEIRSDRDLFRDHFARRFRWWIELLGKSTHPNMAWLVEQDAKEMCSFKWWNW